MSLPLVSIIVTTKNEEKNIGNCLKSISLQTYKNIEIIVVDNNSTDQTKAIAGRYTSKVYNKGPERSAQRNYGILEKSIGNYVMFVDADMILAPNLIDHACQFMEANPEASTLHITEIVLGRLYFSKVRRFERGFYDGTVVDGARFFRKDIFIQVNGFDETLNSAEDWDIDKKIKQIEKIVLLPQGQNITEWAMSDFILNKGINPLKQGSVIYHNEAEFNLKQYLGKKGYYAKSLDRYAEKWGRNDPDVKKQLGLFYRFLGVFVEQGKWKRLLTHPFLTAGMYFF